MACFSSGPDSSFDLVLVRRSGHSPESPGSPEYCPCQRVNPDGRRPESLTMFIIVIPGMISRVLFADELACISPEHCMQVCNSKAGCTNIAYPRLVMNVMPVGLRGLMMAVMLAALMSDLDSIFNSASTIFTLDIYKMVRHQASSKELMVVGRMFVIFIVAISIAWVPFVIEMQGGQMFLYIQEVSDYLTPPIAALFLLGVLWKRCNETGAFWGGIVGFLLGAVRLILVFVYREPDCDKTDDALLSSKMFISCMWRLCCFGSRGS